MNDKTNAKRKNLYKSEVFKEELQRTLLIAELKQLSRDEEAHLEEEFKDYDRFKPRQ
jgi:hypothetical protein